MTDFLWFLIPIGFMALCAGVAVLFDAFVTCVHSWGTWDVSETENAYIQQRRCSKCGFADVRQQSKL